MLTFWSAWTHHWPQSSLCYTVSLSLHLQAASTPAAPVGSPVGSSLSLIPEDGLPPILISTGVKGGTGGHITGACPHPHHSAAPSLPAARSLSLVLPLPLPLPLCLVSASFTVFFISHRSLIATTVGVWGGVCVNNCSSLVLCYLDPPHLYCFFLIFAPHDVSCSQKQFALSFLFVFHSTLTFHCPRLLPVEPKTMQWRRGHPRLFSCSSWRRAVRTPWCLCWTPTCSPWWSWSTVSTQLMLFHYAVGTFFANAVVFFQTKCQPLEANLKSEGECLMFVFWSNLVTLDPPNCFRVGSFIPYVCLLFHSSSQKNAANYQLIINKFNLLTMNKQLRNERFPLLE